MGESARRYLLGGTVILMFAALPALAILQYRWITQAARGEVERTKAGLRRSAEQMSAEFNAELLGLVSTVFAPAREPDPQVYAGRFVQWKSGSRHAPIVRALLLTREPHGDRGQLMRFDESSGEFVETSWPPELQPLRASIALRRRSENPLGAGPPGVREDLPVLVTPRLYARERTQDGRRPAGAEVPPGPGPGRPGWMMALPRAAADSGPEGWVIVWLDLNYFRTQWAPELHRRYFGAAGDGDYHLQILSAGSGKVLFDSAGDANGAALESADVRAGMFDVRAGNVALARGPGPDREPGGPRPPGRWRVLVRHPAGSVEAAIGKSRRLQFAISSGVLLAMAAGAFALWFALRRSEQVALRQMQFVASVSHELRTPLSVIRSAGENLADGIVTAPGAVREYGSVILDQGRRLSYMVEQTLRFAGIQSGRARYNLRPSDPAAILDEAVRGCDGVIRDSGCTVECAVAAGLPPVLGDSASLAVCVGNLLVNAAKHGKDGGWIGVRADALRVGSSERIRIEVRDRGPGIDPHDLPHLFEPFYRGRSAESRQTSGAGLGLALVRQIVSAHHGEVTVSSEEGKGSCFTLLLPAAPQNAAS